MTIKSLSFLLLLSLALFLTLTASLFLLLPPGSANASPPAVLRPPAPAAPAITPGQPFSYDYPRLGMWWPDPEEQSLDDIARYDWITLFDYQGPYIDAIKQRKPEILILNPTNACELSYEWDVAEVQEIHLALGHLLCELVEESLGAAS